MWQLNGILKHRGVNWLLCMQDNEYGNNRITNQ